ncbi:MAG: DUF3298 domain-containing protein [Selenomonadaceae bacterium]|nr:DUF3298 domain-containing protein [Selenomonadaceae bacterium]
MKKFLMAAIFFVMVSVTNFANAAEIDRAFYLGTPDVSYPLVIAKNADATAKINREIRNEVKKLIEAVNKQMAEGDFNSVVIGIDYEIPCNHENGILSIILNQYVNFENSAHPSSYRRGLSFNSDSGARLTAESLSEIAKHGNDYTPEILTQKLRAYSEKNNGLLFSDFQRLTKTPDDFYFDDNLHVHFLFQQYEVAPYAVGIIDLDADATY